MPTTANLVMRSDPQATLLDVEAEIGEAAEFIIHAERRPGRRVVREVLGLKGYDRAAKQFLLEAVYEVDYESA
jgi:pilus assembly protein CpaF